jgi:hypothetical protein
MISVCIVTLDKIKHYEEKFISSLLAKTKLVTEVVLAKNDSPLDYYETWQIKNVQFKKFGNMDSYTQNSVCGPQHGYGLNNAIERATNDIVYLCDPDTFFYTDVDKFFYDLMEKHNLQAIGCSHHSATELGQTFFPWHGNIMMRKKDLPPNDWMAEHLEVKGKYLLPGLGTSHKHLYPNPNGNFDTSSGLWLWAHEQKWKWMAFQTTCVNIYNKMYYRCGNIKILERFPKDKLIYHAVSGAISENGWAAYANAYQEITSD